MSETEAAAAGGRGRKVRSLDPKIFGSTTPRVQELTVEELNQLAQIAGGTMTATGQLAQLDANDLRSLDDAFHQAKLQNAERLAGKLKGQGLTEDEEIFNGWSCCCCTPCCCCAAADVDPFA